SATSALVSLFLSGSRQPFPSIPARRTSLPLSPFVSLPPLWLPLLLLPPSSALLQMHIPATALASACLSATSPIQSPLRSPKVFPPLPTMLALRLLFLLRALPLSLDALLHSAATPIGSTPLPAQLPTTPDL